MPGQLHHVQKQGWSVDSYVRPDSIAEALDALARHGGRARPIAGGSDLLLELDRGARPDVDVLVDLGAIPGLADITEETGAEAAPSAVRLGPLVTHNDVIASETCRTMLRPLAQACWEVGSPQLRNRATVVGNVVTASPANDTISALLALNANVEITSPSINARSGTQASPAQPASPQPSGAQPTTRSVPIGSFITGFRATELGVDELVTGLVVPTLGPDDHGLFVKLGLRRAQAISVVHLAVVVSFDGPAVRRARLAVGSVGPMVELLERAGSLLVGSSLDDGIIESAATLAAEEITPIDDLRATAEYRRDVTNTMVARALRTLAAERAGREQISPPWPLTPPLLATGNGGPGVRARQLGDGPTHESGRDAPDRGAGEVTVTVNGSVTSGPATSTTLLDWLRDHAGTTGVKEGCAEGECGACTVHLGGAAVMACLVHAGGVDGATVVTAEGLAPQDGPMSAPGHNAEAGAAGSDEALTHAHALDPALDNETGALHIVQRAFMTTGAVQCGFCTPGFVMAVAKLVEEQHQPDRATVTAALAGNLCRCTGYEAIHAAVAQAIADPTQGESTTAGPTAVGSAPPIDARTASAAGGGS